MQLWSESQRWREAAKADSLIKEDLVNEEKSVFV